MSDSATPWTGAHQASLSFTISRSLFKLMSIKLVMPSNHHILCLPLLLPPSVFPSIRVFSSKLDFTSGCQSPGASISASVLPMNSQGWFPLGCPSCPRALKRLLQHRNLKASVLQHSVFFMAQHSPPHMTTGKAQKLKYAYSKTV